MHLHANILDSLRLDLECAVGPDLHAFSDASDRQAAAYFLLESLHKKLLPEGNTQVPDLAAMEKFIAVNKRIGELPEGFQAESESEAVFFDFFKGALQKALDFEIQGTNLDFVWLQDHIGPGPGAARLADATWFHTKMFQSTMSYTEPYLIPYYRALVSDSDLWAPAERRRSDRFGFEQVDGGKVFFAKKNAAISRTCCTEPALNVMFQKGVGDFIEFRLEEHFGINLSTQPEVNRWLARVGSVDQSYGTIDLVSASDSISFKRLREWLGPSAVRRWIELTRSPTAILPDGSKLELSMVSTMGNGFTFPLQTIIFASVVRSVYQLMGIPERGPHREASYRNWSVFGDDIIVRREAYDFVCRMLTRLGFEVNVGKSFNNGPFRESCGSDFFRGCNVRGVYIKSYETPQQVYSALNRLTSWSAKHRIWLPRTCRLLLSLVPDPLRIPPSAAVDGGLWLPFDRTRPRVTNSYWFKYRYLKKRSNRIMLPEPDEAWNPEGLCVSIMAGYTQREQPSADKPESFRRWAVPRANQLEVTDNSLYKIATGVLPWWDWVSNDPATSGPLGRHPKDRVRYGDWKVAVSANYELLL